MFFLCLFIQKYVIGAALPEDDRKLLHDTKQYRCATNPLQQLRSTSHSLASISSSGISFEELVTEYVICRDCNIYSKIVQSYIRRVISKTDNALEFAVILKFIHKEVIYPCLTDINNIILNAFFYLDSPERRYMYLDSLKEGLDKSISNNVKDLMCMIIFENPSGTLTKTARLIQKIVNMFWATNIFQEVNSSKFKHLDDAIKKITSGDTTLYQYARNLIGRSILLEIESKKKTGFSASMIYFEAYKSMELSEDGNINITEFLSALIGYLKATKPQTGDQNK